MAVDVLWTVLPADVTSGSIASFTVSNSLAEVAPHLTTQQALDLAGTWLNDPTVAAVEISRETILDGGGVDSDPADIIVDGGQP
jgi:hypothetical protein